MCGISGMVNVGDRLRDTSSIGAMVEVQRHRGPDDQGICGFRFFDRLVTEFRTSEVEKVEARVDGFLGFNRLSILDLSANGHQPMLSPDHSVLLAFNGEIYNAFNFTADLRSKGHVFRSTTDTEVALNLYLEYGLQGMLERLNGMFALAIVDLRRSTVFLARDRFGIKPLYFACPNGGLVFASEIKAISRSGTVDAKLDIDAVAEYLTFRSSSRFTLLEGVSQLLPGEVLEYRADGTVTARKYFDIDQYHRPRTNGRPLGNHVEKTSDALRNSVERQMISDVSLGVQLSGGIDSSLVAYYASKSDLYRMDDAFSIVFKERRYSEEAQIDHVASTLEVNAHKYTLTPDYVADNLQRAVWHMDGLLTHPNAIGIMLLAEQARKHVTVLLSGEGADELMGGYGHFRARWFVDAYAALLDAGPGRAMPHPRLFRGWPPSFAVFAVCATVSVPLEVTRQLIPEFDERPAIESRLEQFNGFSGTDFDKQVKYEMSTYLPELLLRQDKMSMASSLENRVPILDNEFVDHAFSIPEDVLIRAQVPVRSSLFRPIDWISGKDVLKRLSADVFGPSFTRRRKSGFAVPLKRAMSSPQFREFFSDSILPGSAARGLVSSPQMARWYDNLERLQGAEVDALWRSINLEIWCRLFLDPVPAFRT